MAKKKAEVESTEVETTPVEAIEVEETPKAKRGRKKAIEAVADTPASDPILEDAPIVEAVTPEPVEVAPVAEEIAESIQESTPIVEEVKPEVSIPKAKKEKTTKTTPIFGVDEFKPYKAKVTAKVAATIMAGPGISFVKVGAQPAGTYVTISKVVGNWGCIGGSKWININFVEKV